MAQVGTSSSRTSSERESRDSHLGLRNRFRAAFPKPSCRESMCGILEGTLANLFRVRWACPSLPGSGRTPGFWTRRPSP